MKQNNSLYHFKMCLLTIINQKNWKEKLNISNKIK